jgi:hypothetical protein
MDTILKTIVDELLMTSEVKGECSYRYQNLAIVGYEQLDTGQRRLTVWDVAGEEPEELLDLVADED